VTRPWTRGARNYLLTSLCLALACGRAEERTIESLELARGPLAPDVPTPDEPGSTGEPPPSTLGEPQGIGDPRYDEVVALLERECSACHDGPPESPGGFSHIDPLIRGGYLLPGFAESSYPVQWLQYGALRPEHAGVSVSAGELEDLIGLINDLPTPMQCVGLDGADRDQAHERMLIDISRRDPAARPFIRYIGLTLANPPAGCENHPEPSAVRQLVNAISLMPQIVVPEAINADDVQNGAPIFAIDLRDYGWTTPIDVDGPSGGHFEDRWAAIVAAVGPYALELDGPEADALELETQTRIPFLPAGAFIGATVSGPLYAALVGVGTDVNALATSLGVPRNTSPPLRAGIFGHGSLPDRVVTRREQGVLLGLPWWTREELTPAAGASRGPLIDDPVNYTSAGAELMFMLPNGLFAFAVAGSDGRRIDEVPGCGGSEPCSAPVRALTSITCRGCHAGGLVGFTDEVSASFDADPTRYSPELGSLIREQYRPELVSILDSDSIRNGTAVEATTAFRGDIGVAYFKFTNRSLDAHHAADELGVTIGQLRAGIDRLGARAAELAPLLTDGAIERAVLTARFTELACSAEGPRNLPASCP
jgi:hypothetical protein